ncbi:MAG: hypothetical protein QF860_14875 [Planctomycetota bacterium]|nr:hypothetical protein [Planctomycetota bacterium]
MDAPGGESRAFGPDHPRGALGTLETDPFADEVARLQAIAEVLAATESPRLAAEVGSYLTERSGADEQAMARTTTGIDIGSKSVQLLRGHSKGNTFHATHSTAATNDSGDLEGGRAAVRPWVARTRAVEDQDLRRVGPQPPALAAHVAE